MTLGVALKTLLLPVVLLSIATPLLGQKAASTLHDFGSIGLAAPMEYTFEFHNDRTEVLDIHDVKLTPPLVVTQMTSAKPVSARRAAHPGNPPRHPARRG